MEQHIILYDADCGFCRWSLDKILAWDRRGRLRAVALQDPEADVLLGDMDRGHKMESWHLITPRGERWSAGTAVVPLARLLPAGAPIAFIASSFPKTTERVYAWVSRNRNRLGERLGAKACSVDPSVRRS